MKQLSKFPNQELLSAEGPFVTLYQKVELTPPNTEREQIKFKNQLKKAQNLLEEECEGPNCHALLEQMEKVPNDKSFWAVNKGTVAFFFTPTETYYYRLNTSIQDSVEFDERPNVLPMIQEFQYIENYYLLCLNYDKFSLYQGMLNKIEPVELPEDAPTTIEEVMGYEYTNPQQNTGGIAGSSNVHGTTELSDEREKDLKNYYRAIDTFIFENYTRESQLPVILFALTENQAAFRDISKNKMLSEERIESSPSQLNDQQIEKEVAKLSERVIKERHNAVLSRYRETTPQYKLGDQLQDLVVASMEGRIEILFIDKNIEVKGSINEDGILDYGGDNNLLNQVALSVMQKNGKVYVVERAQMPEMKDVAAILRY
ncbi:hypothetical protein LZ578_00805 [Jeotgalibaca sp. MA1X17-3]|uniref:baeRF6 domain-containing protein n=1 Tax=Jeotgalibaca sp. MA1X17-3 TaxID=2908211 RepID=UPI001F22B5D2|nr:hypothetical protein [Jeotgalibaca sp. MA1X17-3]UJF15773.1 hypothetical protein LZ578_00805 [Jeotgalibaca sp. MA1X17-3]